MAGGKSVRSGKGKNVWEKIEGQNGYEETFAHKMALSDAMQQFAREKLSFRDKRRINTINYSMLGCVLSPIFPQILTCRKAIIRCQFSGTGLVLIPL